MDTVAKIMRFCVSALTRQRAISTYCLRLMYAGIKAANKPDELLMGQLRSAIAADAGNDVLSDQGHYSSLLVPVGAKYPSLCR